MYLHSGQQAELRESELAVLVILLLLVSDDAFEPDQQYLPYSSITTIYKLFQVAELTVSMKLVGSQQLVTVNLS